MPPMRLRLWLRRDKPAQWHFGFRISDFEFPTHTPIEREGVGEFPIPNS
jgi:hypothetical protein